MDYEDKPNEPDSLRDTIVERIEAQRGTSGVEPGPQIATSEPSPESDRTEAKPETGDENESEREGRGQKGRFSKQDKTEGEDKEPQVAEEKPDEAVRKTAPDITHPPKRLPVRTKGIWRTLPSDLREDIILREEEFDKSFKRYDGLGQYAIEAERNGTSLTAAVADYAAVETACRRDALAGVDLLSQKMGWNQKALAYALAVRHGVMEAPSKGAQAAPTAERAQAVDPKETVKSIMQEERAEAAIKAFRENPKNIYFEDVKDDMAAICQTNRVGKPEEVGYDTVLRQAYEEALWRNAEIRPFLINGNAAKPAEAKTAAANRARAAAKAVGGPPAHGSNAHEKPRDSNLSLMDTIKASLAKQRGDA